MDSIPIKKIRGTQDMQIFRFPQGIYRPTLAWKISAFFYKTSVTNCSSEQSILLYNVKSLHSVVYSQPKTTRLFNILLPLVRLFLLRLIIPAVNFSITIKEEITGLKAFPRQSVNVYLNHKILHVIINIEIGNGCLLIVIYFYPYL